MNKKVLILHGWEGSDAPHWQSYLATELAKDYGKVSFLKFSNFNHPNINIWMNELRDELVEFDPNIVVCHSLACTLWFHLCNNYDIPTIKKIFLVAPPSNNSKIEELNDFFPVSSPKNLNAKNALLVTSTNDPYLNKQEARELQESLNIDMKVLENAGHINSDSGFGEWKWILEEVKTSF